MITESSSPGASQPTKISGRWAFTWGVGELLIVTVLGWDMPWTWLRCKLTTCTLNILNHSNWLNHAQWPESAITWHSSKMQQQQRRRRQRRQQHEHSQVDCAWHLHRKLQIFPNLLGKSALKGERNKILFPLNTGSLACRQARVQTCVQTCCRCQNQYKISTSTSTGYRWL